MISPELDKRVRDLDKASPELVKRYAVFGLRAMYCPQRSLIENYEVWAPAMNGCATPLITGKSREFCLGYVEGRLDLSSWYIVVDDVIVMSSKGDDDPAMWTRIRRLPEPDNNTKEPANALCPECHGSGLTLGTPYDRPEPCPRCAGSENEAPNT